MYIPFAISFVLSITVKKKIQGYEIEKDPRCHFIDEKIEVYYNSNLQLELNTLKDTSKYKFWAPLLYAKL